MSDKQLFVSEIEPELFGNECLEVWKNEFKNVYVSRVRTLRNKRKCTDNENALSSGTRFPPRGSPRVNVYAG